MTCCVTKMPVFLLIISVHSVIEIRRGGFLNRLVQYHEAKFIEDFKKVAPIKINATIIPTPFGYTDSNLWNFESVIQLIILIKDSDPPTPVRHALRRMLAPTRRLRMGVEESYKRFPSLAGGIPNDLYYNYGPNPDYLPTDDEYPDESHEFEPIEPDDDDDGVIVVSNPVEAKLPSGSISIKLLRNILVNRAKAARQMQTTTKMTIPWIPMNTTAELEPEETSSAVTNQAAQGNSTDSSNHTDTASTNGGGEQSTAALQDGTTNGQEPEKETNAEEEPAAE